MRRNLLAAVAALAAVVTLGAQQAPPQNPPAQPPPGQPAAGQPPASAQQPPAGKQPVFRGGTNQVRVDVTVLNKKGDPVADLTRDDFEVREDGVVQEVQNVKMIE